MRLLRHCGTDPLKLLFDKSTTLREVMSHIALGISLDKLFLFRNSELIIVLETSFGNSLKPLIAL